MIKKEETLIEEKVRIQKDKEGQLVDWLGFEGLIKAATYAAAFNTNRFYCPRNPDKCSSPNCNCT